jgi:hypothetical protein
MGGYIYEVFTNKTEQYRKELDYRAKILKDAVKNKVEPTPEPDFFCQFCGVASCEFYPIYEAEDKSIPIVEL